jgi:hypothetical protein
LPSFTNQVSNLDEVGPILEISVGPTAKLKQVLARKNQPIPPAQRVIALIDTGALGGQPVQCLIGRDILQHGVLVYIGYANQFTLSF